MGSGRGTIENMTREIPISTSINFPKESINDECYEWVKLFEKEELDVPYKNLPIKSYVNGDVWIEKLKAAKDSWYKYNQLGVTTNNNLNCAYDMFLKSVELEPNAWSYRNLAQVEKNEYENYEKAVEYMEKAIAEKHDYQPLWVNYAEALVAVKNFKKWTEVYENDIPENLKSNGRLKMLYVLALVEMDRYEESLAILKDNFVMPDIKEGELILKKQFTADSTEMQLDFDKCGINIVKAKINGKEIRQFMWEPCTADISEYIKKGNNEIELTLINNLRNMQGPFHLSDGESYLVTPTDFYKEKCVWFDGDNIWRWDDDYCFACVSINNRQL